MSLLDSFMFEVVRPMVYFGVPVNPVLEELGAQPGESLLDAGCGFGYLTKHFGTCRYTGVDLDEQRIHQARLKYGESADRRYLCADICKTGLPSKSFDRTVAYGLLHHLSDEEALRCIRELLRLTRHKVVFFDTVFTKYHLTSNLLAALDQGKFVRRGEGYLVLARKATAHVSWRYVYANNAIAKFFMMSCVPE